MAAGRARDNAGVADPVLITIRVHPGASRARIGGWRAEPGHDRVLGVWVAQRAVDGKATQAAMDAVADQLGVRRRSVRLVTGARARVKVIEVSDPPDDLTARLSGRMG
jgi:uncharacterized protein YggU (UPF0235/DUF167 family)